MSPQIGVAQVPPRATLRQRLLQAMAALLGLRGEEALANETQRLSQAPVAGPELYAQLAKIQDLLQAVQEPVRRPSSAGRTETTSRAARSAQVIDGHFPEHPGYGSRVSPMVVHEQDSSERPEWWVLKAKRIDDDIREKRSELRVADAKVNEAVSFRDEILSSFSDGRREKIEEYDAVSRTSFALEILIPITKKTCDELYRSLSDFDKAALLGKDEELKQQVLSHSSDAKKYVQSKQELANCKTWLDKAEKFEKTLTREERGVSALWGMRNQDVNAAMANKKFVQMQLDSLTQEKKSTTERINLFDGAAVAQHPRGFAVAGNPGPTAQGPGPGWSQAAPPPPPPGTRTHSPRSAA